MNSSEYECNLPLLDPHLDRFVHCRDMNHVHCHPHEKPESVERRIRDRCRKSRGRSLADALVAERREEARRESGS